MSKIKDFLKNKDKELLKKEIEDLFLNGKPLPKKSQTTDIIKENSDSKETLKDFFNSLLQPEEDKIITEENIEEVITDTKEKVDLFDEVIKSSIEHGKKYKKVNEETEDQDDIEYWKDLLKKLKIQVDQLKRTGKAIGGGGGTSKNYQPEIDEINSKINDINNEINDLENNYLLLDQTTPQSVINGAPKFTAIDFNLTDQLETIPEGRLQWNETDGTLDLGMGNNVTLQLGQENFILVRNKSGVTIENGKVVYIDGSTGVRPTIELARSDSETTCNCVGITTQSIEHNATGYITTHGYVRQIKTNYTGTGIWGTTWTTGDCLYLSKTDAGQLTNVEPDEPHYSDKLGIVIIVGAFGTGSILISIQKHQTLENLSDVDGTALTTNGQIPVWDNDNQYFDFDYNINDYMPYNLPISTKTNDYTITLNDYTILIDGSSNAVIITLITAVGNTGRIFNIKCIDDSFMCSVTGNGTETIDGETSITLIKYETITVQSDGANWLII